MTAEAPARVRIEPHGPGRVLVLITRRQARAFALSFTEAAWLAAELGRYLAEHQAEAEGEVPGEH